MVVEDGVALARALSKINNTEGINRYGVRATEVYSPGSRTNTTALPIHFLQFAEVSCS